MKKNEVIKVDNLNETIDKFQSVNPSYEKLFKNKTQRAALERLIKKFGREKIENTIEALPDLIYEEFAPTITTPLQLEDKLGQLIAFHKKAQKKVDNVKRGDYKCPNCSRWIPKGYSCGYC